ncbi:MAG TPA: hypothetical protein VNA28_04540 [Solirubrobacteraceae bacterium]|nr:hypothetical protein [Solirubrobacteraceae bacterium]
MISRSADAGPVTARSAVVPAGYRGWETVPGVIRADGQDSFRLEVTVNAPVRRVWLEHVYGHWEPFQRELQDDGQGADRLAQDGVYSTGPITRSATAPVVDMCPRTEDPCVDGLALEDIGTVMLESPEGTTSSLLIAPSVGLVRPDVPDAVGRRLGPDVLAASHVVAVRSGHGGQEFLRTRDITRLAPLARTVYAALPDAFDVLMAFTTSHLERAPSSFGRNFVAGTHLQVRTPFTGTGLQPHDDSAYYGSAGKLQGINVFDTLRRGITADIATHELLHQWGAYIDPGLGISDGAHYYNWSSAESLIGGFRWLGGLGDSFDKDCSEGANGAHHASPLDLYLMGLTSGDGVPPQRVDTARRICDPSGAADYSTVTIDDIQARHGIRTPGPATAQRAFRLGFVVESAGRELAPAELTFYNELARHYAASIPDSAPDPHLDQGWVPITRFFGHATTWRSDVTLAPPPPSPASPLSVQSSPPAPPPPPPAPAARQSAPSSLITDATAPSVTLSGSRSQKLGPAVLVQVACPDEACIAVGRATVRVPRSGTRSKTHRSKTVTRSIAKGSTARIRLTLSSAARAAIGRALRSRRAVAASITFTASDAANNRTQRSRQVKLRR